jgi:hypothetical protein
MKPVNIHFEMEVEIREEFDEETEPAWIITVHASEGKMSAGIVIHPTEYKYRDWMEWCTERSPRMAVGRISRNGDTYIASGDGYWSQIQFVSSTLAERMKKIIQKGKERGYFKTSSTKSRRFLKKMRGCNTPSS